MNHIIIMAGGVGSRFWPMSTPERPKQFIDVLGTGYTLLQLTADRFEGICPVENIWVVTSVRYRELVKAQLPGIGRADQRLHHGRRARWRNRRLADGGGPPRPDARPGDGGRAGDDPGHSGGSHLPGRIQARHRPQPDRLRSA